MSILAYSYKRFSSKQQATGTSLERQADLASAIATSKGWQLVDLPSDDGISAYKGRNLDKGSLGAFLAKVESKAIPAGSVLIIERFDRFSRLPLSEVQGVITKLLKSGINIHSCFSGTTYTLDDYNNNVGVAVTITCEVQAANQYSKILSNRINASFASRLKDCQSGKIRNLGGCMPTWVIFKGAKGQSGEYVFTDNAPIVKRVCLEYIQGLSMCQIAKGLNRDKIKPLTKGQWSQNTISNILAQESLSGNITYMGFKLDKYIPAILNQDEFNSLQVKINENRIRKGGSPKDSGIVKNLFRNRVKCSICGGSMSCSHNRFRCVNKQIGKCSIKKSASVKDVELSFFLNFLIQSPNELLSQHSKQDLSAVNVIKAKLLDNESAINRTMELLEDKTMPLTQLKIKLSILQSENESLQSDLAKENNKLLTNNNIPQALQSIKDILNETTPVDDWLKCLIVPGKTIAEMLEKDNAPVNEAIENIQFTLANNDTRAKLLGILPSIVSKLEIDTKESKYRVINTNGDASSWHGFNKHHILE